MNIIEELKWRGLFNDKIKGTTEYLKNNPGASVYIGFDPTASSLGIGNLVQIILLKHFLNHGFKPIVLLGGATGMIGDPSGKSAERNLLSEEDLFNNVEHFKAQMNKFLEFGEGAGKATLVNNYDWYKNINILRFLRDVGKHLTVNYMSAKDSVKSRLETGISYTEFSYQLLQAYDFYHLAETKNCFFQMGGSDQWGNITSGIELIRRMSGKQAFGLTSPLVTKTDGSKFGKSEEGNLFLSPKLTSPYKFYQFWLNLSDEDAEKMIKIFTFYDKEKIESLISTHQEAPHLRSLQKELAKEITTFVHSAEDYNNAVNASEILFGKSTSHALSDIPEQTFLDVFEGVPKSIISEDLFSGEGVDIGSLLVEHTNIYDSKGSLKRDIKNNALSINKEKQQSAEKKINSDSFINDKYLLIQKGKKNFNLIVKA